MRDYKLVTGIRDLQEASKEGWVFVAIITPHEWLVEKKGVDAVSIPFVTTTTGVEIPEAITTTSGSESRGSQGLPTVSKSPKHERATNKKDS